MKKQNDFLFLRVIPDSSRWLLARNKTTEADITLEKIIKYNNCCLGSKARRELVDSENVTPVKSDRKSRIFSDSNEKSNTDEAVNLLTPTTSTNRNSRSNFINSILLFLFLNSKFI